MQSYASIAKSASKPIIKQTDDTPEYIEEYDEFLPEYKSVIPVKSMLRRDCNYGTWKFFNYQHILNFRDILVQNMKEEYSELEYFYTNDFLSKFSKFLYDNSYVNLKK